MFQCLSNRRQRRCFGYFFIPIRILTLPGSGYSHVFLSVVFRGADEHIETCFDLPRLCGAFNCNNHIYYRITGIFYNDGLHCLQCKAKYLNLQFVWVSCGVKSIFTLRRLLCRLDLTAIINLYQGLFGVTTFLFIQFIFSINRAACLKVR